MRKMKWQKVWLLISALSMLLSSAMIAGCGGGDDDDDDNERSGVRSRERDD